MSEQDPILIAEKIGAEKFLESYTLPINCNKSDEELVQLGFTLGGPVDSILRRAILPEGWTKCFASGSDPRHIQIFDEDGYRRASVFLKAVSYDYRGSVTFLSFGGEPI